MAETQRARTPRRRIVLALLAVFALLLSIEPALRYVRAAGLLLTVIGANDSTRITHLLRHEVRTSDTTLALPHRTLRAKVYTPLDGSGAPAPVSYAIVLHGVHPDAIDEPRLQAFARALASTGVETYTPELKELAEQRILPSTVDDIGACARVVQERVHAKPAALGISFAGGLLLLAAAREPGASALSYVVTVGAHHDLRRVLRYYAGEPVVDPTGKRSAGHADPYGGRVMVTANAELFFSPGDAPLAKRALMTWLKGKYREGRELSATLSSEGRARFDITTQKKHRAELNALLLGAARTKDAELLEVSPARGLGGLRVPVYLVHGEGDPIVPSLETAWLAREVPAEALRSALITPVLRHAELSEPPTIGDQLDLVRFVAGFLNEADEP